MSTVLALTVWEAVPFHSKLTDKTNRSWGGEEKEKKPHKSVTSHWSPLVRRLFSDKSEVKIMHSSNQTEQKINSINTRAQDTTAHQPNVRRFLATNI
jgi:hypothetical protein